MERQPRLDNAETILEGVDGGGRPSPAPERIGAYRLEGRLGIGGMGEVFLAWDERLERRVAIKRIRQNAGLSPEQRERFRREARLAARLSHPAVVQIHDLVSDGPDDAIVMELIEGRTVEERLAAGRLETAEVLRLALEIAEGLAAAHEAGLVHRDLKAANVIITRSGHAKILDFGLARPVVRSPEDQGFTRQGVVLGTCHAMSPEQARGEEVDERSDLFSLGALVHEMLTGRPPFRGNDPFDSLRRVVTEEAVDPCLARPDLPPEAVRLLRRLLAKNRDDRPSSAREVIDILERLRTAAPSGPQTVAPEESVSDFATGGATHLELPAPFHGEAAGGARPLLRWTRRRIILLGAAAVLLPVVLLALLLMARDQPTPPLSQGDLAALKAIEQRLDERAKPRMQDWREMEGILQRNPRSAYVHIVASRVEHAMYQSSREPDLLDRAFALAQRARELAPDDPRPLVQELKISLSAKDTQGAEDLLQEIEVAWPLHPEILPQRAMLEEQRGHWKTAARLLYEAVEKNPSWQNRYRLASLLARHGRIEEARRQIGIILDQDPGNLLAQEQLGHLELVYGDIDRAEQIYKELIGVEPRRVLNSLGQVHLFGGHYREAATVFRSVLEAAPDQAPTLVNLADAEVELGQTLAAGGHYRRALELLDQQAVSDLGLTPEERMLRAQCLARLGDTGRAIQEARAALSKEAEDPELLQQSALVHALAGDQDTALNDAQAAIDRGLREWWFAGSAFRVLREKLAQELEPATSASADPPEEAQ